MTTKKNVKKKKKKKKKKCLFDPNDTNIMFRYTWLHNYWCHLIPYISYSIY